MWVPSWWSIGCRRNVGSTCWRVHIGGAVFGGTINVCAIIGDAIIEGAILRSTIVCCTVCGCVVLGGAIVYSTIIGSAIKSDAIMGSTRLHHHWR